MTSRDKMPWKGGMILFCLLVLDMVVTTPIQQSSQLFISPEDASSKAREKIGIATRPGENGWYKWVQYAGQVNGKTDCYICTKAKVERLFVTNTIYSWKRCAEEAARQRGRVRPLCNAECLLLIGTPRYRYYGRHKGNGTSKTNQCKETDERISMTSAEMGMPRGMPLIAVGVFECFEKTGNVHVGRVEDARCNFLWRVDGNCTKPIFRGATQVKGASIEPVFVPFCLYHEQTLALADHYWWCGAQQLFPVLPVGWAGRCARVQIVQEVVILPADSGNSSTGNRVKRQYAPDDRVYLDAIGQPRGIPDKYKARHEIRSGFESILPWITANKNTEWINYIYYNQQRFINYTEDALSSLGEQVSANSAVAWQNRQALDWLLAEKGGVCALIGEYCCTYIPGHTAPEGAFTNALRKLRTLRSEVKENAGKDIAPSWSSWFENLMGGWRKGVVRLGVAALGCIMMMGFLLCCCGPVLKSLLVRRVERQMVVFTNEPRRIPDMYPMPDGEDSEEERDHLSSDDEND
ncbi:uncharacterized protein LOC133664640 [Entelurus aequoreus]|uniref:uncharacterized protein LOC133664640 n=1 Tax=Entelurus aequoreus TaxID=161455 RepID=UPI002B1D2582|nr:uncharacterized protein LOC133664640 [Entelurus aequoreus]XP_061925427.1 uncharacterized protein LOC133664640 [Entelurus aequoreus]XP_061925428.1 uncharacterized protein LOC133664640 [Entelurus aequoreus]